ncbi:Imm49 family immunity protein [Halopiger djelfimassiliensis]|uniref:Imm49 family immunity protein n=1 Tax=Halopiger djelfimassiliensis TaxID=1293047 RepID=UPI0006777B5F|nr:Imm49 family immunity protein [Halopiger djelfimassiliensis]
MADQYLTQLKQQPADPVRYYYVRALALTILGEDLTARQQIANLRHDLADEELEHNQYRDESMKAFYEAVSDVFEGILTATPKQANAGLHVLIGIYTQNINKINLDTAFPRTAFPLAVLCHKQDIEIDVESPYLHLEYATRS